MLYRFREVKYKQGFTAGTWYYLYNGLGVTDKIYISGLMVRELEFRSSKPGSLPGGGGYDFTFQFFEDSNEEIMGYEQKEEVL